MYKTKKLEIEKVYLTDNDKVVKFVFGYAVILNNRIVTSTIGAEPYLTPCQAPEIYHQRMTAQKQADYLNGKICEFPQVHTRALQAAFKRPQTSFYPGWYYVADKTSEYLCKRLGLVTDWHEYNIMDTFKAAFDWRLQKWMVSV